MASGKPSLLAELPRQVLAGPGQLLKLLPGRQTVARVGQPGFCWFPIPLGYPSALLLWKSYSTMLGLILLICKLTFTS